MRSIVLMLGLALVALLASPLALSGEVRADNAFLTAGAIAAQEQWLGVNVHYKVDRTGKPTPLAVRFDEGRQACVLSISEKSALWSELLQAFGAKDRQTALEGFMLHELAHCHEQFLLRTTASVALLTGLPAGSSPDHLRECLADAVAAGYWIKSGRTDMAATWRDYRKARAGIDPDTSACIQKAIDGAGQIGNAGLFEFAQRIRKSMPAVAKPDAAR